MSPPLSVSKDEYLADLYHFATKEDTYANYFIHVSPKTGLQLLELRRGHQGPLGRPSRWGRERCVLMDSGEAQLRSLPLGVPPCLHSSWRSRLTTTASL